jgi:hypothetical protein
MLSTTKTKQVVKVPLTEERPTVLREWRKVMIRAQHRPARLDLPVAGGEAAPELLVHTQGAHRRVQGDRRRAALHLTRAARHREQPASPDGERRDHACHVGVGVRKAASKACYGWSASEARRRPRARKGTQTGTRRQKQAETKTAGLEAGRNPWSGRRDLNPRRPPWQSSTTDHEQAVTTRDSRRTRKS